MPLLKRRPFEANKVPGNLSPDEAVYYFKLTNEIFRDYDDYFARVILCNSMVWSCSLTGKANLTFQEALDSEKAARKLLKGFPNPLKKSLLYLSMLTARGKASDVVDDVLVYARDRYFKGEEVLAVIGNLWCQSRVVNVIEPTATEIEAYLKEQESKGVAEKNDYLKDDSWGPAPDLFRYEVEETDPDSKDITEVHILEAIDVKREKTMLTRDKCKFLLKLAMDYDDKMRKCVVKNDLITTFGLSKLKFDDVFVGKTPVFEVSLGPLKSTNSKAAISKPRSQKDSVEKGSQKKSSSKGSKDETKTSPKSSTGKSQAKISGEGPKGGQKKSTGKVKEEQKAKKEKVQKMVKLLTPQEVKQIELERKAKEREEQKIQRKMIADFKKLWFKPKEDLEVEDLKDLPSPDPVSCKIPNHLFGDFMMILEFMSSYSTLLKVRDCFHSGLTFDGLERALTKKEIAGPFSDILQLLLKTLFRLQEGEQTEIAKEETADIELKVNDEDISVDDAIQQATSAATWSYVYQNTPIHKLGIDYSTITEVLRLHLLASGARQSTQSRGSCSENDDPGLHLRIEAPEILQTLTTGTVFDLTMVEKLRVIQSLMHQILAYSAVKDIMDESFDLFKQARISLRSLQAAEKRKETEDHLWRQKLKTDKVIPDPNALLKAAAEIVEEETEEGSDGKTVKKVKEPEKPDKPQLTDEQIEAALLKRDKETARRKQDFLWKEAEFLDQINKHERKLGSHPFGRDRAYRRYWLFPTLSGLFVEYDDEFIGDCLPTPTPHWDSINLDDVNFVKENLKKLKQSDREGSDKENSVLATPKKSPKKKQPPTPAKKEAVRPAVFGVCTGEKDSCPVHSVSTPRPKWSFFWDPDQIDALIAGLTPRGIREKELRQGLMEEKDNLKTIIKKCPVTKLNKDKKYPENIANAPERRPQRSAAGMSKSQTDPNLGFPGETMIDTIMELQLRDLVLETEEKIFLGGLGSLKVGDRADWRTAVEARSFKPGTDVLKWGGEKTLYFSESGSPVSNVQVPVSKSSPKNEPATGGILPPVKDLACAILQLQQSVEAKFLNRPLVEKEEEKKKKSKPGESEPAFKISMNLNSHLERWQSSLMASTSFSQLFVHFYTLESSVEWSRSVLNARCRICRRKGDPDNMLLCDKCNKGHHAYCLKPPLEDIPRGDWFCADCRPPEPLPTPIKRRKQQALTDEDIMNELDSEDETDDERGGQRKSKKMSDLQQDEDLEVCAECGFGGEVICCDACPLVYHLLCLNPPKTRVPRGVWHCPECTNPGRSRKRRKVQERSNQQRRGRAVKKLAFDSSSEEEEEEEEEDEEEEEEEEVEQDEESEVDKTQSDASRSNTPSDDIRKDKGRRKRIIEEEESESERNNSEEEEHEEEKREVVKVKFATSRKRAAGGSGSSGGGASSSTYPTRSIQKEKTYEDESESDQEEPVFRGGKRKSASRAAEKISHAAKRLRSDSKENETSETSNDSNYNNAGRKSSFDTNNDPSPDGPKRTRLQRMNTNNRVENGELDNVLLDKLISDVMKQNDAWPFLKPVTRTEAPDYHEIVTYPMDLGTIKYKLNSMVYTCNEEFISDLLLVFTNCFAYNEHSNHIYEAGRNLQRYCEKRCSKLGINFSDSVPSSS